ncbi:hypothetical protein BGP_3610 [Beggiatoa sp. PS]|nr:hypothetical protein BGP_3610 [Beggiatoa sp. PS]
MRTLFLLLFLLNSGFLLWQVGQMPWLPWQPESFRLKSEPIPPLASNLPQLKLLNEYYNRSNSTEKTVTNFADISIGKTNGKANASSTENTNQDQNQQSVAEKNAKPVVVPSILQQVAGLSQNSKPEVLNTPRQSTLAQQITQNLPTSSKYANKSMACFNAGPYNTIKIAPKHGILAEKLSQKYLCRSTSTQNARATGNLGLFTCF